MKNGYADNYITIMHLYSNYIIPPEYYLVKELCSPWYRNYGVLIANSCINANNPIDTWHYINTYGSANSYVCGDLRNNLSVWTIVYSIVNKVGA